MCYVVSKIIKEIISFDLYQTISKFCEIDQITDLRLSVINGIYIRTREKVYNVDAAFNSSDVEQILSYATRGSLYAYNDYIVDGFVPYKGLRIGIVGEIVSNSQNITSIKNIHTLYIRFPHEIFGAGDTLIKETKNENILIFSPPGCGKTTILRDFARQISMENNVIIFDYKNEISATDCGITLFDVGRSIPVVNAPKPYLETVIRNFSPEIIIIDEIGRGELCYVERAIESGVRIVASAHYSGIKSLPNIFDRYFCISKDGNLSEWVMNP